MAYPKLTALETEALAAVFNLGDAHTHQSPTSLENNAIFKTLSALARQARELEQAECERRAISGFFRLLSSDSSIARCEVFPNYSSSISMECLANLFRLESRTSILIPSPTFDNIPDILRRHRLNCQAYDSEIPLEDLLAKIAETRYECHVLMLVNPNNPTGRVWSIGDLQAIGQACRLSDMALVIDGSFRLLDDRTTVDIYTPLLATECEFYVIEDSGKIWPTQDLKVAFTVASRPVKHLLREIHDDVLLNVSPFVLLLVANYAAFSFEHGLGSVRDLIQGNRELLTRELSEVSDVVTDIHPESRVSVAMLSIKGEPRDIDIAQRLIQDFGVAVLPLRQFYWDGRDPRATLRIALARDRDYFKAACRALLIGVQKITEDGEK